MYISSYPLVLTLRRSAKSVNVSDVYEEDLEVEEVERTKSETRVVAKVKKGIISPFIKVVKWWTERLLIQEITWLIIAIFFIVTFESDKISSDPDFTVFHILFEVISAYGTVGLSLGYPGIFFFFF